MDALAGDKIGEGDGLSMLPTLLICRCELQSQDMKQEGYRGQPCQLDHLLEELWEEALAAVSVACSWTAWSLLPHPQCFNVTNP